MDRSKFFYRAVLVASFVFYAGGFFWLVDGWLPGVMGLLLLPFILVAADALGITQRMRGLHKRRPSHPRQYVLLRTKVGLLLDIVKRVNWLAVDMSRGVRTASETEEEIDKAVVRMKELVDEIRDAAGRTSDGSEAYDAPVPVDQARDG